MGLGLRTFLPDGEAVAREWRQRVETCEPWRPTSTAGDAGGEATGYFVTSGPINGYAKPSKLPGAHDPWWRSGHEKVAADLAFDLGLPLPPTVLHKWAKPPYGDQRFVAISLFPWLYAHKWQVVARMPDIADKMKIALRSVASALVPFDTWLDNTDRANDGNLIVSSANLEPGQAPHIAYIDYGNAMMCRWRNSDAKQIHVAPIYPTDQKDADITIMDRALTEIECLSDDTVRAIVSRIPDDFLPADHRSKIANALVVRKPLLRGEIRRVYGAIP